MSDERKGNASGNSYARHLCCPSEEGKQLAKHVEALESLASEDAIQTVLASQLEINFSKFYLVGLVVDIG